LFRNPDHPSLTTKGYQNGARRANAPLRNQNLLHPRNKRGLDFEQSLNDCFGLFSRNVLDIQTGLFRFGEEFRIFERIGKGAAK
jgi:hypothetical protein